MASRKDQKEQARAARLAKEQEEAARKQRTRRLQIFGGITAVAVAVIVAVVLISTLGNSSSTSSGLKRGTQKAAVYNAVNSELKGIPESGTVLGDPSAKVTLTYFGDLQCPVCQEFTLGTNGGGLPQFIQQDVRTGVAKVDYRSLCTATCNDYSNGQSIFADQQSAAYAAGKQNLFWYYAELFYRQQGTEGSGYVTTSFLNTIAEQIPSLNLKKWATERTDPALTDQVTSDESVASTKYGFDATPSFAISGPKGTSSLGSGVLTYATLEQAVKSVS
jgi:protein-disulfide isomerase